MYRFRIIHILILSCFVALAAYSARTEQEWPAYLSLILGAALGAYYGWTREKNRVLWGGVGAAAGLLTHLPAMVLSVLHVFRAFPFAAGRPTVLDVLRTSSYCAGYLLAFGFVGGCSLVLAFWPVAYVFSKYMDVVDRFQYPMKSDRPKFCELRSNEVERQSSQSFDG